MGRKSIKKEPCGSCVHVDDWCRRFAALGGIATRIVNFANLLVARMRGGLSSVKIIGLFKTEVIWRRGPWKNLVSVEYATLE